MSQDLQTSPYLRALGVTKSFRDVAALDGASVSVEEGEALALLGPSGCGKTTLLRIVAGLEKPDTGRVVVAGDTLTAPDRFVPPEQRRIGMVFQDWALFPHMTVARNVGFGLSREEIASGRVAETLEMVGLGGYQDRRPDELSGGQAQRVALARALAPRPRVMLFDEPFSNLDTELRGQVRADVTRLLREVGMTSVFVTHDQEEAFVLGDTVAVMRAGRVLQVDSPAGIYSSPASPWVASFVGEANILPGEASAGSIVTAIGRLPAHNGASGSCHAVVRPEYLAVADGTDATISSVEFYGHDSTYEVAMRGATYTVRVAAAPTYRPGDSVNLTYVGPAVVAFPASRE
jgi:iron(III) transport system ATP-binding protein